LAYREFWEENVSIPPIQGLEHIMRQVLIYPGEDGYFVAEVPSLPGCISQGKTREEAVSNIKEAIGLYIDVLREQGRPIPEDLPAIEVATV
jgi:predicted RNase H-like HicB family nuclease